MLQSNLTLSISTASNIELDNSEYSKMNPSWFNHSPYVMINSISKVNESIGQHRTVRIPTPLITLTIANTGM